MQSSTKTASWIFYLVAFTSVSGIEDTKRLLVNDADVIRGLQLKIQNLESLVGNLQQTKKDKGDIGFHAELTKTLQNLPHDTVVVFDKVVTNVGGAYDPSSGVFTCPEDGLYSFAWTTLTNPGHILFTQFTVNGHAISSNHNAASYMKDGKTGTKNVVVNLKQGNKAWIKTYQNLGQFLHKDYSTFSGFKV